MEKARALLRTGLFVIFTFFISLSGLSHGEEAPSPDDELASAEAAPADEPVNSPSINEPAKGEAAPRMPVFTAPYRPNRAQVRSENGTAVLNFSEAALKDVIRTVSELTGANFIISPGIAARITVYTAKPVPKADVMGIFESILEANGLASVKTGSYYKIVAAQNARQRAAEVAEGKDPSQIPSGDRVINLIVPIEFVPANEVAQVIKPMLSQSGNIINYQKANTLVITDTASNIRGHLEVINLLDVDAFEKMKFSFIPVKNVDVKTLSKELSEVFAALGMGKDTPQISIIPLERLNSLIVFSSTGELMTSTKEWAERLDVASGGEGSSTHIYYVQNDKAANLKNLLEQVYNGKKALPSSVQVQQVSQVGAQTVQGSQRIESRVEGYNGEIRIFIYEPTNALVILSSQVDYQSLLATIKELDRPPKQVLIDALIAEVKLDESTKYGIQWSILEGNFNIQQNTGIVSTTIADPKGLISSPLGLAAPTGLSVFTTDASKFFAILQALATTGKVNVLSNPHVIVKNYEKASINIGSDEPVATQSTQTAVTGTAGLIQNIEYRKTGIILTVTPQITEGGVVAMSIRQEVSDKSTDRTVGNAVYPSFTKREAETSVVARNRETLVIGGLIQERNDDSKSGIPLLSSIPFIGGLFRFTNINRSKTELIILLTPSVISDSGQGRAITEEVKSKLGGLKQFFKKKE